MPELRFAILGTGFWSRYQLAGWRELSGAQCVAVYNRTRAKAEALATAFNIPSVYDDAERLINEIRPDFIDVITDVTTHRPFVELAARHKIPVICQKPLAPSLADAESMVQICQQAGIPLLVNENWRWQTPLRALRQILAAGEIGPVFRARIDYCNSYPVFENQPFLKETERFILADIGSHIFDALRFLFGEAVWLCCQTQRVHRDIKGEDVATTLLQMRSGATVVCNMSYASRTEHEKFPQTYVFVEGAEGSVELGPDYWVRVTTRNGTTARQCAPPVYPWADPRYVVVHSSIVDCQRDLLQALRNGGTAETTGADNLKSLKLVYAAYQSAASGTVIRLNS